MWRHPGPSFLPTLAAPVLFGLGIAACKPLLGDIDPVLMAGGLYFSSGAGLGLWAFYQHLRDRDAAEAPLRGSDWPWLGAAVVLGGIAGPALLMVGLRSIPANTAALLLNLETALTVLLAWAFFGEHIGFKSGFGIGLVLCASAALSWEGGPRGSDFWGALAVMGACLAWALDNNLSQYVSGKNPVHVAAIKGLVAGAFNLILAVLSGASIPGMRAWLWMGGIGFVSYGVSLVCFLKSLRNIGTARTGMAFALAPFIGAAAGLALLREPLTVVFPIAAVCMGFGIRLSLGERHEHDHLHDEIHEHAHEHDEHHRHAHAGAVHPSAAHSHVHSHEGLEHSHPHGEDIHHRTHH